MLSFFGALGWRELFERRLARIAWTRHPILRGRPASAGDAELLARKQSRQVLTSLFAYLVFLLVQIPLAWFAYAPEQPGVMVATLGAGALLLWSLLAQLRDRRRALRWATWAPRQLTRSVFR